MKKLRKRALAFAAASALALTLFGCAQGAAEQPEARAPASASASTEAERAEESAEVENNGGYYVRVGEKVYFRRYGADALPETAVSGKFTSAWNANGGDCELMAYTPATGELAALYTENGTGPLWYGDGGFYLRERLADEDYVIWYALSGGERRTLCRGVPLGVTESGLLAVESTESVPEYRTVYTFYRNGEPVGASELADDYFVYAGMTDAGIFLLRVERGEEMELWSELLQLTPEGELIDLGALPEVEGGAFYGIQADRFLASGDKVVVGVGYYAGTGSFLDFFSFVEATAGQAGSVRALDSEEEAEDFELPRLAANGDGTISIVPALPGELRVNWDYNFDCGDLEVFDGDTWNALDEVLCPTLAGGSGYRRIVQHMDYVDGTAYVTLACAYDSPADSVGWRDAFTLLDMLYLAIDRPEEERELACVDHRAELYGEVWFIKDSGTALWRQLRDDDAFACLPQSAYLLPIADDADWGEGGEAAYYSEAEPLNAEYDLGEPDYNGYSLPDVPPAGRLCLTLNRDGEITGLANKGADAVLAIDFDLPARELAGAVETLDVERRGVDEDTPWFWTKLRALEDGVRVRVERTPDETDAMEDFAMEQGVFIAGETLCDHTLNRGEYIALRASLPWHPELRVCASKNGAWGGYVFGEDNYLHLESEEGVHPELTLAAYPAPEPDELTDAGMSAALTGTWLYRTPPLRCTAAVRFDEDGSVSVESEETRGQLLGAMDRLYAEAWEAPDILTLRAADGEEPLLSGGAAGDYLVELFRTDGKEILCLTQANNGDGALSTLIPNPYDENLYTFTLTRDCGVGAGGARRRGETFAAEVVRYDRETYSLWLTEAETVESEYEDGGVVWRAKPNAPCLAYPISGRDAILSLRACRDPEFPMRVFNVTVDDDGTIQMLA